MSVAPIQTVTSFASLNTARVTDRKLGVTEGRYAGTEAERRKAEEKMSSEKMFSVPIKRPYVWSVSDHGEATLPHV